MTRAMILCAGFGTRLQEFTKETPKPMLPVCGRPLLEYTIGHLSKLGIKNLIINLHYFPDKITGYFKDGRRWGVRVEYSFEEKPLGTAGAVKKAEAFLTQSDAFLVLYGDVVCNENYLDLLAFHKSHPAAVASIILHERSRSNSVVEMDGNNKIIRFIERPRQGVPDKRQNWVNSGLYCFNKKILELIPKNVYSDFPGDIFPRLASKGVLYGYPLKGYRCAIDSPERYNSVQRDFEEKLIFD